ncbi:hypothetical protein GQ457_12G009960 [Hibiscus cannabinus]
MKELIDRGGLGFRDIMKYNMAFLMKIGFHLITEENKLWERVLRDKYGRKGDAYSPFRIVVVRDFGLGFVMFRIISARVCFGASAMVVRWIFGSIIGWMIMNV